MKKIPKIFIDHFGNDNTKDGMFAQKIKDRLNSIKQPFTVKTYKDLDSKSFDGYEETSKELIGSDIVIPIVSSDYLSFAASYEEIFNDIIASKDKYLFPILYSAADWTAYSWIVKSKLIPENNIPLLDYSDNEADKILNDLISKIGDIITNSTKTGLNEKPIVKGVDMAAKFVFISHDHDDGDFAELLKLQLEKEGINGWIDNERLKIGQDWRQEIDDGITNAIAVIAIMTPEARKSEYVTYEWAFAWGKGKKIFPLMLKQTQLHPRLESLQYLDFTKRNSRPFDSLIRSIKDLS